MAAGGAQHRRRINTQKVQRGPEAGYAPGFFARNLFCGALVRW